MKISTSTQMGLLPLSLSLVFSHSVMVFIGMFCALAICLAGLGIFERIRGRNAYTVSRVLRNMIPVALIPSAITVIVHIVIVELQTLFNGLDGTTQNEVGISIATLIFGGAAFCFKVQAQFWYGLVELIAAVIVVVNTIVGIDPAHPNHLAVDSAVIGGLYIVVRGLSNMTEAALGKVNDFDDFIVKCLEKLGIQEESSVSSSLQARQ